VAGERLGGDVLSDVLVAGLVGSLGVVSEGDNGPVVGGVELLFVDSAVARRRSEWLGGVGLVGDDDDGDVASAGLLRDGGVGHGDVVVDLNNLVHARVAGQWLGGDGLSDVLLAVVGLVGGVVGESEASDIDGLVDWRDSDVALRVVELGSGGGLVGGVDNGDVGLWWWRWR
jgi:hypothetical protein